MFCVYPKLYPKGAAELLFVAFVVVIFLTFGSVTSRAQRQRAQAEDQPLFVDFKGVHIGMPAEEARKKLGSPRDKSDEQDFYVFSANETAQIVYAAQKVVTISADYTGGVGAPEYKAVVGNGLLLTRPDGSVFRMVMYDSEHFWVSYNKSNSMVPTVTITIGTLK